MREDYGDYITAVFCLTNAYKYLYRAGIKEGESQKDDIAKAQWYYNYVDGLDIGNFDNSLFQVLCYDVMEGLETYENN